MRRAVLLTLATLFATLLVGAQELRALDRAQQEELAAKISGRVCSDGGEWLTCYQQRPSECEQIAEGLVKPCVAGVLREGIDPATPEQAQQLSRALLRCFNARFSQTYDAMRLSTAECKRPVPHLE